MTRTSNDEFAKRLLLLGRPGEQFTPTASYDPDGDCIEFLAKPDPFFAERIDELVTVYYSQDTGEVIGSLIKGVSKFCREVLERAPGFRVSIEDGPVHLEHLFLAWLWMKRSDPQDLVTLAYRRLIDVARQAGARVEGELCVA
jgi:hypothetical protein